jgi:hypothetical protein
MDPTVPLTMMVAITGVIVVFAARLTVAAVRVDAATCGPPVDGMYPSLATADCTVSARELRR